MSQNIRYNQKSKGDFKVFLEKTSSDDKDETSASRLAILLANQRENGMDFEFDLIRDAGRKRFEVTCRTFEQAIMIVDNQAKIPGSWKAYIPENLVYRYGVLQNVDPDVDDETIRLQIQQLYPHAKIERITTRDADSGHYKKTSFVKVGFPDPNIPDKMILGKVQYRVRPYIKSPMQCKKCWEYNHTTARCKSRTEVCKFCGTAHEGGCEMENLCKHCQEQHPADSKECSKYKKEKEINFIAATRGISFGEARRLQENLPINSYQREVKGISYAVAARGPNQADIHIRNQSSSDPLQSATLQAMQNMNENFSKLLLAVNELVKQNTQLQAENRELMKHFLDESGTRWIPPEEGNLTNQALSLLENHK